jgi:hypothetical protein
VVAEPAAGGGAGRWCGATDFSTTCAEPATTRAGSCGGEAGRGAGGGAVTGGVTIDRTRDVPLDIKPSATGAADFYDVTLVAITANGTSLVSTPIKRYRATDPHVRIDPSLLVANQNYLVVVFTNLGYPNASTGDFITTSVPFGVSDVEHTFVVAN